MPRETQSEAEGGVFVRLFSMWATGFILTIPFWLGLIVMAGMMELGYSDALSHTGALFTCFGIYGVVILAVYGPGRL